MSQRIEPYHGLLEPSRVPVDAGAYRRAREDREEWKTETVEGRRFLRRPDYAMLTNIPVGGYLAPLSGPGVMWVDSRPEPWSVIWPDGRRCGIPEDWARELLEQDRIERNGNYRAALALVPGVDCASFVEKDVPEADVRRGDVLVCSVLKRRHKHVRSSVRGSLCPLGMEEYETLRTALEREPDLLTLITPLRDHPTTAPEFLRDRRSWGQRLKVWHSRLFRVRAVQREHERVSRVIRADNDEEAVARLLEQVGT